MVEYSVGVSDHAAEQLVIRCMNAGAKPDKHTMREHMKAYVLCEIYAPTKNETPPLGGSAYSYLALINEGEVLGGETLVKTAYLVVSPDTKYGADWMVVTVLDEHTFNQRRARYSNIGEPDTDHALDCPFMLVYRTKNGVKTEWYKTEEEHERRYATLVCGGIPAGNIRVYEQRIAA